MTLKYDDHGRPYEDLTDEHKKLTHRVKELDSSLSIALDLNDQFQREMEKLKAELSRAKEEHQYDNLVHAEELRKALKK
jgi:predicted RNase H-like nuclease (RuvC/YqgF family)